MDEHERRFVNPYTFVPFFPTVVRRPAPKHTYSAEEAQLRFSGSFNVTWHAQTPIVLPQGVGWYETRTRQTTIPGSSAKGAIRSVHEALFGGCPRMLTEGFTPVYRQPVSQTLLDEWQLAVVVASDRGVPSFFQICKDETVWIDSVALKQVSGVASSGDVISFDGQADWHKGLKRFQLTRPKNLQRVSRDTLDWTKRNSGYALLVTDTGARKSTRKQRNQQTREPVRDASGRAVQETAACFWAAGELTKERIGVLPETWAEFRKLVEGTRDREDVSQEERQAERDGHAIHPEAHVFKDVSWWNVRAGTKLPHPGAGQEVVARRRRADGRLLVGDVVWVKVAKDFDGRRSVTGIKLAAAWRESAGAAGTLSERAEAKPCTSDEALCLTCSMFGSVDPTAEQQGRGEQDSYGGHVRFGAVRGQVEVGPEIELAPLASPHPGAGMFYLKPGRPPGGNRPRHDLPSQWGSSQDDAGQRVLRGRKFYWHSDPYEQARQIPVPDAPPRYAVPGPAGFDAGARLVQPGEALTQKVTFDGLERGALLTLLAAFDPGRILPPSESGYAVHLGGGKPLGLGTVRAEVSELRVQRVAQRYAGPSTDESFDPSWSAADLEWLRGRVGDYAEVHRSAATVLAIRGLGEWEAYVTYPTRASWGEYDTESFRQSFEFFGAFSGEKLSAKQDKDWRPLPELGNVADGAAPWLSGK